MSFACSSWAQQSGAVLIGTIRTDEGDVLPGTSVSIANTSRGAFTDSRGLYRSENLPAGRHTVIISYVGYQKIIRTVPLHEGEPTRLNVSLKPEDTELDAVAVIGRSEAKEVNRQAFNVTAIDASKLHNSTLDLSHALDRVSGVRVGETGGVGSSFKFSLNGAAGQVPPRQSSHRQFRLVVSDQQHSRQSGRARRRAQRRRPNLAGV